MNIFIGKLRVIIHSVHIYLMVILYGIDVFVDPKYQGMCLKRRQYENRKELCENLNLRCIISGRISNQVKYSKELTPKQYIEKVKSKKIYDPVLSFQLANDFYVRRILKNYLRDDVESKEYAILLVSAQYIL